MRLSKCAPFFASFFLGFNAFGASAASELKLVIDYDLQCDSDPGFGALRGEVTLPDHSVRFDLALGNHHTEILLGSSEANSAQIHLPPSKTCRTSKLNFTTSAVNFENRVSDAVLRFSPFYVVRGNQLERRNTDVPLSETYNIFPQSNGNSLIQYNLYYTDEDSKLSARSEDGQMARYGRRLDIQWSYRVEITPDGKKVGEWYQGGILGTSIGHQKLRFRGDYLPGTDHPVLYDIANHNAYSDRDCDDEYPWVGYLFAEMNEIHNPVAREAEMFARPWMFLASDLELRKEKKLSAWSDEYLYVRVQGEITKASLVGEMKFPDGQRVESGGGVGDLDRLGEDTWGVEAYTALPIGRARIGDLLSGRGAGTTFSFSNRARVLNASLRNLAFFALVRKGNSYVPRDISDRFVCQYSASSLPTCVVK